MPSYKQTILYLNEKLLSKNVLSNNNQLQQEITNSTNSSLVLEENNKIISALSNSYFSNKIKTLDLNIIFKMYYDLLKNIFYSFSNNELANIKIYSDFTFYYYIFKNYSNLLNNLYNIFSPYKGYTAYKDYYSYYYTLFKDNKCAIYPLNVSLVLDNISKKDTIIDLLQTIQVTENSKITPMLWQTKDRFFDAPNQITKLDVNSAIYNTEVKKPTKIVQNQQLIVDVKNTNRSCQFGCFTMKISEKRNSITNKFTFNVNTTNDDIILDFKNNKTIRLASIYEMFDFFLDNMQFKYHNPDMTELLNLKQKFINEKKKIPNAIRQYTDIDYIKKFEGKPWERYFIIEFFIKNNLLNETKMQNYLKPKNYKKYQHIKKMGLSSLFSK